MIFVIIIDIPDWAISRNLIAIFLLRKPALKALKDYETQKSSGVKEPLYDVEQQNIDNADIWKKINSDLSSKQ